MAVKSFITLGTGANAVNICRLKVDLDFQFPGFQFQIRLVYFIKNRKIIVF